MTTNLIQELLRQLPDSPGVYIMRDAKGNVLYVGKAKNLHNRVRSYFVSSDKLTPKTRVLVEQINDFEYLVVSSEQEALILELNLIKRYWPPYNVLLKDDKNFPYLKIKFTEQWPRLHISRRVENDGSHYFGPFANIQSLHRTLDVLKRIFPLRSCTQPIVVKNNARPCLKYHMGYCLGPCAGSVSRGDYDQVLSQLILFLEGKHEHITRSLKRKMGEASESLDFERAARFRDQLKALEDVIEGQSIAMKVQGEQDAIAYVAEKDQAYVQVFMVRRSKLIGRESFILKGALNEDTQQIMTSFVKQYYNASSYIPKLVLLQYPVEDKDVIENWLSAKKKTRVRIEIPQRGKKKQLIDIASENARQGLEQLKIKQLSVPTALEEALAEIQKELSLTRLPSRIEGYDISNIQGEDAVGSMVVFEDGKPRTSHYRRFKIKTVEGANDYAMLKETLRRRFKRAVAKDNGTAWSIMPDLILIDGGKGQLNAARDVLKEMGFGSISLASLAKENEEIYILDRTKPIVLPRSSIGLKLLQRLRDEAHRFAITYFQKVHKKRTFKSALDEITGIGPKKKKALIKKFGTIQAIRQASIDDLMVVEGISLSLARKIRDML
jgi:excinuclease ABC subunit C